MNGKGEWGQNHVPRMKLREPSLPEPLLKLNVHLPDTVKGKPIIVTKKDFLTMLLTTSLPEELREQE